MISHAVFWFMPVHWATWKSQDALLLGFEWTEIDGTSSPAHKTTAVTLMCLLENLASVVTSGAQPWFCPYLCIYAHLLNYSALLTCHFLCSPQSDVLASVLFGISWRGRLGSVLQLCDSPSTYDCVGRGLTACFHRFAARCSWRGRWYFSCACLSLALQISNG